MLSCGIVTVVVSSILAIVLPATVLAQETTWGCYDPQPGHPTPDEHRMFVERMRRVASQVQAEFGVPRASILAMAVQERGYSWTRTAMHTNNFFGWKFGSSTRAAKLNSWTLECQPPSDPDKDYAVFPRWEESMRFVAWELAQQDHYSKATLAARRAIAVSMPEENLMEEWLRAIQKAGYHPNPRYPDNVLQAGRKAGVFLGWTASATTGSDTVPRVETKPLPPNLATAEFSQVLNWLRSDNGGRYMITGAKCTPEHSADWPGYEMLPDGSLQRCQYAVTSCIHLKGAEKAACESKRTIPGPKAATVVLLEPGLERFARWIVSACIEVGGDRSRCLKRLYAEGRGASNWQIPIAGIVFEDMAPNYVQYGYSFRDGLTVKADSSCGWRNGSAGERSPTHEENVACSQPDATPQGVSNKVRPMSTTRKELVAWRSELATHLPEHDEKFPIVGPSAESWRQFVRESLVTSFSAENNPLVTAKAFALRRQGKF